MDRMARGLPDAMVHFRSGDLRNATTAGSSCFLLSGAAAAELHRTNSRVRLNASGSTKTQKSYLADNGRAAAVSTGR